MRHSIVIPVAVGLVLAFAAGASAHPSEFVVRKLGGVTRLDVGPPGPAPVASPRASSKNVRVLGHVNPGGFNGDVVAHRGYAYLGSWGAALDDASYEAGTYCPAQGVRIYSLFNRAAPQRVATFADGASNPVLAGSWTEKVIVRHVNTRSFVGDLAAISFQDCRAGGFRGIGLYDVTDPTNPTELSLYEDGIFGVHELWLQPRGNRVYVWTATIFEEIAQFFGWIPSGEPDFRVIDVTDPANPRQVGSWGAWRDRGVDPFPGLGSFPFNFVHSVVGNETGDTAYLSYWDYGTVILDMRDPAKPRYVGRTEFAADEEGNAHSAWTAAGGNVLIQTDEDADPSPFPGIETSYGYTRIYDVKDPTSPRRLSTFKLPTTTQWPPPAGEFTVHDPKVQGSSLYLSHYSEGVVVVDISRPANPRFIAQFLPEPATDPFGFWQIVLGTEEPMPFVWGVYPERDIVLASDINNGLWVFQVR